MFSFRNVLTRRLWGAVAISLALALPGLAQTAGKPTLLVFPFDRPENVEASIPDTIASALRNRIQAQAKYDFMTYNTRSALVQRAIRAGEISRDDADGPFEGPLAGEIAHTLGLDFALAGIVDDADVDVATNSATVTASARLVNARNGNVIQNAAASSTVSEAGVAPDALLRRAADDAAAKIVAQLFQSATPTVTPIDTGAPKQPVVNADTGVGAIPSGAIPAQKQKKKKNNNFLLLGGVLVLGIIIAAGGGGAKGNGGGGGGGNPPSIPL